MSLVQCSSASYLMSFHHQGVLPAQQPPPSTSAQSTSPPLWDTSEGVEAGVDPSFLAALPEDLRQLVLEEEEKMKRAVEDPASPAEVVMKAIIYDRIVWLVVSLQGFIRLWSGNRPFGNCSLTLKLPRRANWPAHYEPGILLHKNTNKVGFWRYVNWIHKNICHYKPFPSTLDIRVTPSNLVSDTFFGIGARTCIPPEAHGPPPPPPLPSDVWGILAV